VDCQLIADIEFPDADNVVNQVPGAKVVSSGARAIGTFGNKFIQYPASEKADADYNIDPKLQKTSPSTEMDHFGEPQPTPSLAEHDGGEVKDDDQDEELWPLVEVINTPKRK
jgi:hypothetical protein